MKFKKAAIQPHQLPLIKKENLVNDYGSFRLNPFMYKGFRLRIIGYDKTTRKHTIKDETRGVFAKKTSEWLERIIREK